MRIAVSLTSADPLQLGDAARRVATAGADSLHIDFGDGDFVPWLGGSVELVAALRSIRLPVDVHLMVNDPERYFAGLGAAGAAAVAVHVEAARYPWRLREMAHRLGMRLGLAVNPVTPISAIESVVECADYVMLLSTEPDGAGERALPGTAARVKAARRILGMQRPLEVDGGVNLLNASGLVASGADCLVVGRAMHDASNGAEFVASLRQSSAVAVAP